ncbi:hypothetical protein RRG08_034883 [Elysia crispata]|uniref:Beta-lactamase-related domain-containing protein n=1 Tax=Elysia crispata TaxID=231223 RepID=A0AAE0ZTS4_9GAST|nr:hypothetical protein RRG08_034883 [Elysia crispata]
MLASCQDHAYSVLSGDKQPNDPLDVKWKSFDDVISNFLTEQGIPGASVAISRQNKVIYKQGYGISGCSRRVQPDSVFRIASISKPVTAAIVMHVCGTANVSLEKQVFGKQGILKKYRTQDKRMKKISIRHLLQHSAGWDRDKVGDAAFVRPQCVIQHHPDSDEYNQALLSYALRRKLQFSPGTWHAYSNLGYLALGQIIQEISGESFERVMEDFLLKLGIQGITVGHRERSSFDVSEVEYFNNKDPVLTESLYPNEGLVLPQYGGMAMPSSASYGGLVANSCSLLQFLHCMETALLASSKMSENFAQILEKQHSASRGMDCLLEDVKSFSDSEELKDSAITRVPEVSFRETVNSLSIDHPDGKSYEKLRAVPLMTPAQARETFQRPVYEDSSAGDWYGLGWDVQDNGATWGHTGGMEGTCGTLYHHGQSGLSWVFLLNAWAQDCDLNGVIKSGLMMTDLAAENGDSSAFPGLESVKCVQAAELTDSCQSFSGTVKVVSENKQQIILLNSTELEALETVSNLKGQGYFVTWINCITQQLGSVVNLTSKCENSANKWVGPNLSTSSKSSGSSTCSSQKYCLIFERTDFSFTDYITFFNMSAGELVCALCKYEEAGYYATFLDSYCWNSSLRFNAVLCLDIGRDIHFEKSCVCSNPSTPLLSEIPRQNRKSHQEAFKRQTRGTVIRCAKTEVLLAKKGTDYVNFVRSIVDSYLILMQTVTEVEKELWVSVVLRRRCWGYQLSDQVETLTPALLKIPKQRKAKQQKAFCKSHNHDHSKCTRLSIDPVFVESTCGKITRSKHSLGNGIPEQTQNKSDDLLQQSHLKKSKSSESISMALNPSKSKQSCANKDTVYWVQISPESFLTELHRQIQKGRSLQYVKFYTVSEKPFVSAVWTLAKRNSSVESTSASQDIFRTSCNTFHLESDPINTSRYHRTAMSKYGLLPELAEGASKNLILQSLSEYCEEDGGIYYAAVWFASSITK